MDCVGKVGGVDGIDDWSASRCAGVICFWFDCRVNDDDSTGRDGIDGFVCPSGGAIGVDGTITGCVADICSSALLGIDDEVIGAGGIGGVGGVILLRGLITRLI